MRDFFPQIWCNIWSSSGYLGCTEFACLVPSLISQELDGVSFMLLTCSTLTDVLTDSPSTEPTLTERDAVALCSSVARVKYSYFTAFSG